MDYEKILSESQATNKTRKNRRIQSKCVLKALQSVETSASLLPTRCEVFAKGQVAWHKNGPYIDGGTFWQDLNWRIIF